MKIFLGACLFYVSSWKKCQECYINLSTLRRHCWHLRHLEGETGTQRDSGVSLDAQQVFFGRSKRPPSGPVITHQRPPEGALGKRPAGEKSSVPLFLDFFRIFYFYRFNSITFSLGFLQCLHWATDWRRKIQRPTTRAIWWCYIILARPAKFTALSRK